MTPKDIFMSFQEAVKYPLFSINQTPVSAMSIMVFLVILLLTILISRLVKKKLLKSIFSKFNLEIGIEFTLTRITQYLILMTGLFLGFQSIGIDLSGLAVIVGFLSVGIGFGLQNVTSNFVSGLILLFERPIKVGDRVTVGDKIGDVENIRIRSTTIRTLNNISIIVPNTEFISNSVINWSHGDKRMRLDLEIGVSYNSDLQKVINALTEVAKENLEILQDPPPEVLLREFGDSAWNMQLRVWLPDPKRFDLVKSDLNCAIVGKFRENEIEIPFPQRDLHFRTGFSKSTQI